MGCENRAKSAPGDARGVVGSLHRGQSGPRNALLEPSGRRSGRWNEEPGQGEGSHVQKLRPKETWKGSVSAASCEFTKERETAMSNRS